MDPVRPLLAVAASAALAGVSAPAAAAQGVPPKCVVRPSLEQKVAYAGSRFIQFDCQPVGTTITVRRAPQHAGQWSELREPYKFGFQLTVFYQPKSFVGVDSISLRAVHDGIFLDRTFTFDVQPFKMRAIGDSVTAGFGYLSDGSETSFGQLFSCKPPSPINDRCSSNSTNGPGSTGSVNYASDYGLGNSVSWAAQLANRRGLRGTTMYRNLAVSGAEPKDWDTGGALHQTLRDVIADDPNLTVMTLGANPVLGWLLLGEGRLCSYSLSDDALQRCVLDYAAQQHAHEHLVSIYRQLLEAPDNHIYVSGYHLATPGLLLAPTTLLAGFSTDQIEVLTRTLNEEVFRAVVAVKRSVSTHDQNRIMFAQPPRFPIGKPSRFVGNQDCNGVGEPLHRLVDGESRQAGGAQAAMYLQYVIVNPIIGGAIAATTICPSTEYWTTDGDSGIHPSRAGYAQFANVLEYWTVFARGWVPEKLDPDPNTTAKTHVASVAAPVDDQGAAEPKLACDSPETHECTGRAELRDGQGELAGRARFSIHDGSRETVPIPLRPPAQRAVAEQGAVEHRLTVRTRQATGEDSVTRRQERVVAPH
jgi:lysophospholipase L1-like esterase